MSNRRTNLKTLPNTINFLLILTLLLSFGLACGSGKENQAAQSPDKFTAAEQIVEKPRRLEGYEIRGVKFAYYLIPKNLSHEELVSTAQIIHEQEPDTQLILVDDDSQLVEYIAYAKQISLGNNAANMPKKWADMHIIGNVQKYLSGKWVLCEGKGFREIAELK